MLFLHKICWLICISESKLTMSVEPEKAAYNVNELVKFTCKDINIPAHGSMRWNGKTGEKNDVMIRSWGLEFDSQFAETSLKGKVERFVEVSNPSQQCWYQEKITSPI